jgi:hypothetical protein
MNKKNTYIRIILTLLCIPAASSFYLFSSYQPAGKRDRNYAGPMRIRQKPRKLIAQPQPIQDKKDVSIPAKIDQPIQNIQQPAVEPTVAADTMQAKSAPSSPGWLMTAYIVFLSTLNKAFGTGIDLGYKPLSQSWKDRQDVLNAKNQASEAATKSVESGEFDENIIQKAIVQTHNMPQGSPEINKILGMAKSAIDLPKEQKIAITTEKILKKLEPLEKKTSFGSIVSQTAYLGLFNTAARLAGGLIGFGATMLLQNLMPTQSE